MASVRIPVDHREVVAALTHLDQDKISELNALLLEARSDVEASRTALAAFLKAPSLALDALVGMTNSSISHGLTAQNIAEAVRDALGDEAGDGDLTPLLGNNALLRLAKRFDVGYSHERLVSGVRVFTEMRPIFDDPVSDSFGAAVVTHSLRILSFENSEPHELYFTMDYEGLKKMAEQVARAQDKEAALRSMLKKAGVTVIVQPEGEN